MKQEAEGNREEVPPRSRRSREGIPAVYGGEHVKQRGITAARCARHLSAAAVESGRRGVVTWADSGVATLARGCTAAISGTARVRGRHLPAPR